MDLTITIFEWHKKSVFECEFSKFQKFQNTNGH